MPPRDGSYRLLGAQEGPEGQLILKYNLPGLCRVGFWLGLPHRAAGAGFQDTRHHQWLQTPQASWFGVKEGIGRPDSLNLGGIESFA